MSDAVDKHIANAFASLEDVTVRELEATAEALERRRDRLGDFSSVFRNVAGAREGGWSTSIPRYHVREAVDRADENFLAQIAGANAPFWAHFRAAVEAHQEEQVA
jgi:hypothetical protein